jgi:hypothetical protein
MTIVHEERWLQYYSNFIKKERDKKN